MKTSTQQRTVALAWDMAELLELKTGPQDILVLDRKSIPRTSEAIQRAKQGSLVFLKGHRHPTHRDSVHHRSPAIPHGGRRLCLVLDC